MKNKLHYFILLFVLAALTGCNEKLSIETEIQGAPEISEFTPTSGKAGTEITVKGSNLRDIVSATIGGVESQILYKLSQQEIVIVVPREGTKSGKIVLATSRKDDAGESTRAESAQSFSVTYPTPRVTDFPKGGRVGNNVEILGADLDIISKVFMGDEEGEIIYQSEKEIAVKVPFIIDDEATVSLKYANQTGGESEIKGESGDFIVEKDEPEIEKIDQESLMERSLLTLGGKNLNLIEYIYFGEEKYAPVSQNGSTIVFRVPTLPETRTVKIKVTYYRETKEIILSDACEVIRMKNLFSANQAIGTRNSKYGYGSMLNGNSADGNPICTPCVLKEEENFDKIDFAGYVNSGLDFALNSPDAILNPDPANTKNNLKNY
ncbi:IPT/TIG domain-containing protein, partial [Bacteroides ovatus]